MVARRYVVVGTGGIGGFYGARLQAAGFAVTFVGRSDVEALNRDGLHVASPQRCDRPGRGAGGAHRPPRPVRPTSSW